MVTQPRYAQQRYAVSQGRYRHTVTHIGPARRTDKHAVQQVAPYPQQRQHGLPRQIVERQGLYLRQRGQQIDNSAPKQAVGQRKQQRYRPRLTAACHTRRSAEPSRAPKAWPE